MNRRRFDSVLTDLEKKMVFVLGPRQVGKTWLSKEIATRFDSFQYLNFDQLQDRDIILKQAWLPDIELLIFDEIHKLNNWKSFLKGVYDTKPDKLKILVTGSARLHTYKKAGDSLAGRFFSHRLMPLSYKELMDNKCEKDALKKLMTRGAFPEPFLAKTDEDAARWRKEYVDGLIREDVTDFDSIQYLNKMTLLLNLLRARVGSPVSFSALARDLEVSSVTVKKYMEILEALFIIFKLTPFLKNIARSLLKEPKVYFFDTGLVTGDDGAKFENVCALELLNKTYQAQDLQGKNQALHYIRTKDGKEVDFCIVEESEIIELIEAKYAQKNISKTLYNFAGKFSKPTTQLLYHLNQPYQSNGVTVLSFEHYFQN